MKLILLPALALATFATSSARSSAAETDGSAAVVSDGMLTTCKSKDDATITFLYVIWFEPKPSHSTIRLTGGERITPGTIEFPATRFSTFPAPQKIGDPTAPKELALSDVGEASYLGKPVRFIAMAHTEARMFDKISITLHLDDRTIKAVCDNSRSAAANREVLN